MARQWLWMCVWVVVLVVSGSAHSRRQNDHKKGPEAVLVETLRQVLGVPKSEGGPGYHHKTHRPPRYMVHLYQRITDGHGTLPRRANTVRSYTPKSVSHYRAVQTSVLSFLIQYTLVLQITIDAETPLECPTTSHGPGSKSFRHHLTPISTRQLLDLKRPVDLPQALQDFCSTLFIP
ncbi:uncharacterized protein LOC119586580 [Penaeus monodon]|uniref:uncharacterized protein LOC119586580 n=1 Tax=Penaeus monodon TaxID=6687 RepID=UPI0018A79A46|nr:uncharacterized protein LOC119586580 [Penaeus monodon]